MGTVGHSVVGSCGDHHSDYSADDRNYGSDEEGNGGPDALLGEQSDDNKHDSDEDEADEVLRPQELLSALHESKLT